MCAKRQYVSIHQARLANRDNGQTLRCYRCPECHAIHVTKSRTPDSKKRRR